MSFTKPFNFNVAMHLNTSLQKVSKFLYPLLFLPSLNKLQNHSR
jgi:hypothetical protein